MADEKKENNGFSGWWNKTKNNINSSILESNLEKAFNKENIAFINYNHSEVFSNTYYGYYKDDFTITVYGNKTFKSNSVLIDKKNNKAFYIVSTTESKVKVKFEGQEYERDSTDITLDPNVEEVSVIKAGDKYYKYKG
ncbi:MAG: hypothetical protein K6E20_05245 [Acholeplasmatales bacterium]|nr:hypothetical protein [Acholeplasmatales bacterium]